ncbi:MAG: hypothetical protein ACI9U2_001636 [Bradymonadia bacterium]|jgi:hypothetical protein
MPETDRKKIASDPKWAGTRTLLKRNLSGTDLDVTHALMANKMHRADAIRLKEKIDAAQRSADHDAIHKALEGVKPEDMEKVAAEFAHTTGKVDLDDGSKIEGLDAKKTLAAYPTQKKTEMSGADKLAIGAAPAMTPPSTRAAPTPTSPTR